MRLRVARLYCLVLKKWRKGHRQPMEANGLSGRDGVAAFPPRTSPRFPSGPTKSTITPTLMVRAASARPRERGVLRVHPARGKGRVTVHTEELEVWPPPTTDSIMATVSSTCLHHQFEESAAERDIKGGMLAFLVSEVMLFGAMSGVHAVPLGATGRFTRRAREFEHHVGAINTKVLCSPLHVVMGGNFAQLRKRGTCCSRCSGDHRLRLRPASSSSTFECQQGGWPLCRG